MVGSSQWVLPGNTISSTAVQPLSSRATRLPITKVGAAWLALRKRAANPVRELDRTTADWVSTVLLTGWREGESAALRWEWIDWEAKTITLPGDLDILTEDPRLFVVAMRQPPSTEIGLDREKRQSWLE